MKKPLKILARACVFLIAAGTLIGSAKADNAGTDMTNEVIDSQYAAMELDEIDEAVTPEAKDLLEGVEVEDGIEVQGAVETIFRNIGDKLGDIH